MPITYLRGLDSDKQDAIDKGLANISAGFNQLEARKANELSQKRAQAMQAYQMAQQQGYEPNAEVLGAFQGAVQSGDLGGLEGALAGAPRTKEWQLSRAKTQAEIDKLRRESGQGGGKQLTATEIARFNEGAVIPRQLQDVEKTIEANKDIFGPIAGRISAANPYNTQSKTLDAQLRAQSQSFGRYMEGGVLRKEDEEKYRKMFPQLSDTPEVAKNKLAIVQRMLGQKQTSDIDTLQRSGYNVAGFQKNLATPDIPQAILPTQQQGGFMQAVAAPQPQVRDLATIQARKAGLMKKAGMR